MHWGKPKKVRGRPRKNSAGTLNAKLVQVWYSSRLLRIAKAGAEERGQSLSEFIRRAVYARCKEVFSVEQLAEFDKEPS